MKILALIFSLITLATSGPTFFDRVEMDKTTHDMGEISIKDGPVSCAFKVTNIGDTPLQILTVVSSCGCTGAKWTKELIAPGASGTVTVTYDNNEGPYPFDKSLTVYFADIKKPVVLHVRGTVSSKKKQSK